MPDLSELKSQAGDFLNSDSMKKLMPYLLSGGAGAVLGGAMSGRRRKEQGEGRGGYLMRILRNAAMTGGLAAGGHALLNKGLKSTVGAVDSEGIRTGAEAADQGPLATTAKNVAFSPLTAGAAGGTALALTHGHGLVGHGAEGKSKALKALATRLGEDANVLETATPDEVKNLTAGKDVDHLRRKAGLPTSSLDKSVVGKLGLETKNAEKLKGALSTVNRKWLSSLGQTPLRRSGRGALALAAAGIPALAGAFMTDRAE